MPTGAAWITAREAASRLDVKLATLYAYASRGLVKSVPAPSGRGRRYDAASIAQLRKRHDARAGHAAVAVDALQWGEPSLETGICEIRTDGPAYRGESAVALCARGESFESVADLLWEGKLGPGRWTARPLALAVPARVERAHPFAYLAAAVSLAAVHDEARHGASVADELARARRLVPWLASIVGGRRTRAPLGASIAARVLIGFGVTPAPRVVRMVDRALILCADHELNASTFATRVTASTGADLYACLGTGLFALSGPLHGGVSARVEALLREIGQPARAREVVRARLARGEQIPGFGHRLYESSGDPRAHALLALAGTGRKRELARIEALRTAMAEARQPMPNLDLGLVALTQAAQLPEGSAAALFAIGRLAGWIAHALEQRAQGYLLRPRARYVASSR
ncbi:MAG: citrate/2-methylcitrate synthase [Polyangiales bacterium]